MLPVAGVADAVAEEGSEDVADSEAVDHLVFDA